MKHRLIALFLLLLLLCGCAAVPQQPEAADTRSFTDDCGRTVTVPAEITRIAVTGPLTQLYVLPLCGDLLVGHAGLTDTAKAYLPDALDTLPELGQLYGGKGSMDPEALLAAAPQLVLDLGEPKASMAEDLDQLSEQTGIPFVHIDATVETTPRAYRTLGQLLNRQDQAETLALWCEDALATVTDLMARVDADGARKSLVYCLGDKGLHVLAEASFHAETLNLLADNAAKLEQAVSSGAGNEIDPEQLMVWDPEVLIFAPDSIADRVADDPVWQQLQAVQNGSIYQTPEGPYGWLASPPSVQRYLGMLWLAELLYPSYTEFDLQTEVTEYYDLFYGYALSDADYAALTEGALP